MSVATRRRARRSAAALATPLERYALLVVWVATCVVFGILRPDTFLTTANFSTIFGSQAVLVVLTLGLLIPLTAGDYDLSVAATMTLAAMMVAILNVNHGWSIWRRDPRGARGRGRRRARQRRPRRALRDRPVHRHARHRDRSSPASCSGSRLRDDQRHLDDGSIDRVVVKRFLGIPLEFYYGSRSASSSGTSSSTRRSAGACSSSAGAAGRSPERHPRPRLRWGALVALRGDRRVRRHPLRRHAGAADPTSGLSFLLPAFAAAFLGATTILPGRFNPWGSIAAVYFLVTGITGLQLLGVQSFVQQLFYGGALVLAVALSQAARREARAGRSIDRDRPRPRSRTRSSRSPGTAHTATPASAARPSRPGSRPRNRSRNGSPRPASRSAGTRSGTSGGDWRGPSRSR